MSGVVLVLVAHSDDETLGCGGTIARLAADGRQVHVASATDGVGARFVVPSTEAASVRVQEFTAACRVLGAQPGGLSKKPFPDNELDSVPLLTIVKEVERLIESLKPSTVYTHHTGDLNIDHQIIARAVVTAARPYPGQVVKRIYGFEVPGSTEWAVPGAVPFVPTRFVPLTDRHLNKKTEALRCYTSELREAPHPRAPEEVEVLACVRGSQCGHDYAEAFTVIREIV